MAEDNNIDPKLIRIAGDEVMLVGPTWTVRVQRKGDELRIRAHHTTGGQEVKPLGYLWGANYLNFKLGD